MVTAFRILSIDVTNIPNATRLLQAYTQALTSEKFSSKQADSRQRLVESYIGKKLDPGTRIVNGKIGQKQSADYLVPSSSKIIQALYKDYAETAMKSVEFKASTRQAITIGQTTIKDQKAIYTPGISESFSAEDVKKKILGVRQGSKKGFLVDLDPNLKNATKVSEYIFNNYFAKDKRLKQIFYQKASTVLLANTYNINGKSGNRLIGIAIPERLFTADFFKAYILGKAIVLSVKDNFQNNIIREINRAYLDENKKRKGYKKSFAVNGKTYSIDYLPTREGTDIFGMEITNSIKVRPVDTFTLRAAMPEVTTKEVNAAKNQKFISGAQWTYLVRQRLGQTMGKLGPPEPPFLKERSGRFRNSIQISANYRAKAIQYIYNPLYSHLEKYGYTPDLQIEGAIRDVAKMLYAREFNIYGET